LEDEDDVYISNDDEVDGEEKKPLQIYVREKSEGH
jgi:hypothetical protein